MSRVYYLHKETGRPLVSRTTYRGACAANTDQNQRKEEGYLRFLKSCIPSIVVTYWKPDSISLVASLAVVAPVQFHSSSL